MSKLCLSTYLSVLIIYKCQQDSGQLKILNALIRCICDNPEPVNAQLVSHIKSGKRNLPRHIRDEMQEKHFQNSRYMERFKANVEILLDPGKIDAIYKTLRFIALNDDSISADCVIDYFSQTTKSDLSYKGKDIDFIAGVFLYVIRLTNNKTSEYADEISKTYCENAVKEFDKFIRGDSATFNPDTRTVFMNSDLASQAKAFCRQHENDINLLPLCPIANVVNPRHNHVNKMYSAYCDCSDKLKEQIMSEIECPLIHVDDKRALYHLLWRFQEEVEKMELASRDKTNMFSQYIVKTLSYENQILPNANPSIFPMAPCKLFPNITTSTLSQFISDYLYYKDKDQGVSLPVPFDWMWEKFNFASCYERDLVSWLNLFVISSCYSIDKTDDSNVYESLVTPEIYDVKTMEDMHFLALLMLYNTYMCR